MIKTSYRFPPTEIPAEATSFFGLYLPFNLSAGEKQHIVAIEPVINNTMMVHHMVIFGCRKDKGEFESAQNLISSIS